MANRPDLDGGSGDSGPAGGGGVPGTGTGSSTGASFPIGEHGGVLANTYYLFVPVQDTRSLLCYVGTFDITSFDDIIDDSSYTYRAEDIVKDCVPTVNRVVLTYRDLGPAKLTVAITASNDNGQVIQVSQTVSIGNVLPTNKLLTRFVDLQITRFRPQITLSRAAQAGPVCITAVTMRGTVSDTEQY